MTNFRAEAAAWEARYKSVVALVEPRHVEAAERVVNAALEMSRANAEPFVEVVAQVMHVASRFKTDETLPPSVVQAIQRGGNNEGR